MMHHKNMDTVEISYDAVKRDHPAQAAILLVIDVEADGTENLEWIPRSQIIEHDEEGHTVTIPQWLAEAKGLI